MPRPFVSVRVIALAFSLLAAAPSSSAKSCCKAVRTSFGEVAVPKRDVARATELGNLVSRNAREVLRLGDVRLMIVDASTSRYRWGDSSADGAAVYPWRFAHGGERIATQPPDAILPHEIAHDLLRRHVFPHSRAGQYGSDAPDWIDESVAIAFELPADKAQRRCEAASLARSNGLIPLRRYLAMDHPDLASTQSGGSASGGFTYDSKMSGETPAFYAMSIAFPEYLGARTGSESILADAILAYQGGAALDQWVVARAGGHSLDAVERDFAAWLASSPSYRCGG